MTWTTLGIANRTTYRVNSSTVDLGSPPRADDRVQVPALPQTLIVDLARTALVVIDMQNDFLSAGGWAANLNADLTSSRAIIPAINHTTATLRKREVPIIWLNWGVRPDRLNLSPGTRHTFNPDGSSRGLGDLSHHDEKPESAYHVLQKDSWGAAIHADLTPAGDDIFVDKHRISGFWDTPLDSIVRNLGVRTLLFSGVNVDQCVLATLMDASFHGYDTIMIEDAVATTSPEFCMQAALFNVRFCFGFTVKAADLCRCASA
jgi:nicotinamidase-related amidase